MSESANDKLTAGRKALDDLLEAAREEGRQVGEREGFANGRLNGIRLGYMLAQNQLRAFLQTMEPPIEISTSEPQAEIGLDDGIELLGLTTRTRFRLGRADIRTIGELMKVPDDYLLGLRNFGAKSLEDLLQCLADAHFSRKEFAPLQSLDLPLRVQQHFANGNVRTAAHIAMFKDEELMPYPLTAEEVTLIYDKLVAAGLEPRWNPEGISASTSDTD